MPTHYKGTDKETLALDTYIKLTRANESFITRLHQRGAFAGFTISQFGVLEMLCHLGPMSLSDIGAKLLKSSGNITLVIDNLEKQALVQRQRDATDRRTVIVSLTTAGQELISSIFPDHATAIAEEMSCLTAKEQQLLSDLCRKLGNKESRTK